MEKYMEVKENASRVTHLKVFTSYHLGGTNLWTYKEEPRGYYLTVTPVERRGCMESVTAFTGAKVLVKEVTRKSKKAEAIAESKAADMLPALIDHVLKKNGLELLEARA